MDHISNCLKLKSNGKYSQSFILVNYYSKRVRHTVYFQVFCHFFKVCVCEGGGGGGGGGGGQLL